MRTAVTLFSVVLLFASCRSVQTMVDKGQYDRAIDFAARKLHGQDNPKTRYVQGLEEAYAKVTERDLENIETYKLHNTGRAWRSVYEMYTKMQIRQQRIAAFLPLVSRDGYVAHFEMYDLVAPIAEARNQAIAHYYAEGLTLLSQDGKIAARQALDRFNAVASLSANYRDVQSLITEARYQGTTRVAVSFNTVANDYIPGHVHRQLTSLDLASTSSQWVDYFYYDPTKTDVDIEVVVEIDDVDVTAGLVDRDRWTEEKIIERSRHKVRGTPHRDSLQTAEVKIVYDTLVAELRSIRYRRQAEISARMVYYDHQTGAILSEVPVTAVARYDESGLEFDGDRKALSKKTLARLRKVSDIRLPETDDMIVQAGAIMKSELLATMHNDILTL